MFDPFHLSWWKESLYRLRAFRHRQCSNGYDGKDVIRGSPGQGAHRFRTNLDTDYVVNDVVYVTGLPLEANV